MARDKQRHLLASRLWKKRNRKRSYQLVKEWKMAHPEYVRDYHAAYRRINAEKIKAYRIKRRDAARLNPAPEKTKTKVSGFRARTNWCRGSHKRALRAQLMVSQNGQCKLCHIDFKFSGSHLDHIIPASRGGSNLDYNFQLLCPRCNQWKGASLMVI